MTIDVGTGDGRAVWRWARDEPARLAIGIDANASGMGPAARRAARPKTLRPNALFVVASAESLPHELAGVADRVTVQFPWGSLLRGVIAGDGNVLDNLAMIAAPGAALTVLWSVVDRDRGRVGSVPPRPSEERFGAAGFDVCEARPATAADVAAAGSTWAKRLRAGVDRPASLLRAVRR